MSKQRRGRGPERGAEAVASQAAPGHDADADLVRSENVGNAAFQAGMQRASALDQDSLIASLEAVEMAGEGPLGRAVASGLRQISRDVMEHARLVAILERSALPQREALAMRLESQQEAALAIEAALAEHLGGVGEAERSRLADAFASATGPTGEAVAAEAHRSLGSASPGMAPLAALCAAILAHHRDEEDGEEPLGVDYATEESGM